MLYFKKSKNVTEMQKKKKICAVYGEGALTEHIKSGLQSFLVLLTFLAKKFFAVGLSDALEDVSHISSTSGLHSLEANSER